MKTIKAIVPDVVMIAGWAGVSYGAWTVYEPAGFIVGGVLAIMGGIVMARAA